MADIQSAAQWLGRLIAEEARYLYKVEDKVKELRDELEWMHCFLREADKSQFDNALARRWVSQIREFAYEAEDTTEKFLSRVITRSHGRADVLRMVKKYSRFLWEFRLLHQIGSDIDTLKYKMSLLSKKLRTYNIKLTMSKTSSSWQLRLRNQPYISDEKKGIIGREQEKDQLVKVLLSGEGGQRVLCISGVSGVGKTFLAKNIFHDSKIRQSFDAFAWAYVSQPCQSSAIQQDLLSSLTSKSKEQIAQMEDSELKDELRKIQCKYRCFIVLDGIWEKEVWVHIQEAFPITNNHYKSKLLITSQLDEIAKNIHGEAHTCKLGIFINRIGMKLLDEKVKGFRPADTEHNSKDDGLVKLKKDMLEHCEGLPLAISVLGGLLETKKTMKEWREVYEYLKSYETYDNHQIQKWKRILEMSYYDLPFQLKPSFLYLGYFPTNLEIPASKIFRLWEAEGLVSSGDDEVSEDTLEDVAERCLRELIERSFLQVGSRGLTGEAKTCLVHNLMHTLCMDKASQGNWLSIVKYGAEEEDKADQSVRHSTKAPKTSKSAKKKFRRLAIYYSSKGKLPPDYEHARYIRSLLFFNSLKGNEVLIPLQRNLLKKSFERYKLLRVLDIENIEVQKLPNEVGFLIHLRYLSLKGSSVSQLPKTMKNLRCLQTLDLRVLSFVHLRIPDILWRMDRLVHLFLPKKSFAKDKLQLKRLRFLETLSNFSNTCSAEDVGKLVSLRKFSSCDFLAESEIIKHLLGIHRQENIRKENITLEHVEHLSLRLQGHLFKEYSAELGSCKKLYKLWVKGEIAESLPSGMPENLIKISFQDSNFQIDPMEVLEKLPHLKMLKLSNDSYQGTKMKCSTGRFRELSHLTLKGLKNLEDWELRHGAMQNLSHLKITSCQNLKMIPPGIKSVKNLQVLAISFMPRSFFEGLSPTQIRDEWTRSSKVGDACIKISHVLELKEGSPH